MIARNDPDEIESLANALRISPITAAMLLNRGISRPDRARDFLQPSLHHLSDPTEDPSVTGAARFLKKTILSGKKITIYGDFDADGICACALMVRSLRTLGASVDFYVPRRFDEGYGLNIPALKEIKANGADVVVTVDCGISACEEVKHANSIGLEMIITDHHQPRGDLPAAAHLLNPQLEECRFGYENLSGVGVAFKLAWALGQSFGANGSVPSEFKDTLVDMLPLVAIGTVADMAPMEDENRVCVNYGLRLMPSTTLPGLRALLKTCGIADKSRFRAYNIGFQIAPRLNAIGRMSDAAEAIEMLITEDPGRAEKIAAQLEQHNRKRQAIQRSISEQAIDLAVSSHDIANCGCIVLSSPDWHPGVAGLVASKLVDQFARPAFVFCEENGIARGSARSVPGFHLFNAVSKCSDFLHRFGGHKGAVGMTLPAEHLERFREHISAVTMELIGADPAVSTLNLECEVELNALTEPVVEEFDDLEPYGEGNPQPVFAAHGLTIAGNPQLLGARRNHLSFFARQENISMRVIAFGKPEWLVAINERRKEPFSLAFQPRINTFNGNYEVELRAEDIRWTNK